MKIFGNEDSAPFALIHDIGYQLCLREQLNKCCDMYHRTNSTRLKFRVSMSKSNDLFQLIHRHICGLYKVPLSARHHFFL